MTDIQNIRQKFAVRREHQFLESARASTDYPHIHTYDRAVVFFSGGKDSVACLLHLLDIGFPKEKIEIHHHLIDGKSQRFMDWPVTEDYCRKFGEAFGIPVYFSWKMGGFKGEMLREDSLTQPIQWENPDGTIGQSGGVRGNKSTRRKFPQVSTDLKTRWCSCYLKIHVGERLIANSPRFNDSKTLVITGERAEESPAREKYATFLPHSTDKRNSKRLKRHVDQWRPVHKLLKPQVWELLERYRIRPHPAYILGWGRTSCSACIFGSSNQWASLAAIDPDNVQEIAAYETEFNTTIHRKKSVTQRIQEGTAYDMNPQAIKLALSETYTDTIIVPDDEEWVLPSGAFGESCGPT